MDDSARKFGMAERAKAIKQRDESQVIIDYWDRLLGMSRDTSSADEAATDFVAGGTGSDPSDFVAEGELIGMSAPKAIKLVMERMMARTGMRRPLRVAQIHSVLVKGGIDYKKDFLYTTLTRSPMFHTPQKGLWGLAEWYPAAAKKSTSTNADPATVASVTDLRPNQVDPAPAGSNDVERAEGG